MRSHISFEWPYGWHGFNFAFSSALPLGVESYTEAVDEKLLTDVGKVNGFTVYQLTDEGKERVKQIMRGKRWTE